MSSAFYPITTFFCLKKKGKQRRVGQMPVSGQGKIIRSQKELLLVECLLSARHYFNSLICFSHLILKCNLRYCLSALLDK